MQRPRRWQTLPMFSLNHQPDPAPAQGTHLSASPRHHQVHPQGTGNPLQGWTSPLPPQSQENLLLSWTKPLGKGKAKHPNCVPQLQTSEGWRRHSDALKEGFWVWPPRYDTHPLPAIQPCSRLNTTKHPAQDKTRVSNSTPVLSASIMA